MEHIADEVQTDENIKQEPQVFVESIQFNDGTSITLTPKSIVVFTGPNNCGKSQVLKDIDGYFDKTTSLPQVVVKSVTAKFLGDLDDDYIDKHFYLDTKGRYTPRESNGQAFAKQDIRSLWRQKSLSMHLNRLFIKFIDTEKRLTTSKTLANTSGYQANPIYKISRDVSLANLLSKFFRQAFANDLSANRIEFSNISLHIGNAPDRKTFTMENEDEYYKLIAEMPLLDIPGDGMRSFASILLDIFVSKYNVIMIDEPEAFLHPPQSRLLGRILTNQNKDNQQLFISTHSNDFLQGLIDVSNENVTVIRIDRRDGINHMNILQNEMLKDLWGNPILRYSNILSGLFHEKVIVCESDYDCLFYQALVDAIYENNGNIAPNILFVHCGGKPRIKSIILALKALNVKVLAVPDFDVFNIEDEFRPLTRAFGIDWDGQSSSSMRVFYNWLGADPQRKKTVKTKGFSCLTGDVLAAYQTINQICTSVGLFIVPYGEIECFDLTVTKKKRKWVDHILVRGNMADIDSLSTARAFIHSLIEF